LSVCERKSPIRCIGRNLSVSSQEGALVGKQTPGFEAIETASRDKISALQLARLKKTLAVVYERVPFYRDAFKRAGVHPRDLRSLSDLKRFPFTTKDDLRQNYPFGLLAVPRADVVRLHASSGTTGTPTLVAYTKNDIETWANLVARSIHAAGGRKGDIVHVAYGYERLGCTVVPMSGGQTEKQLKFITDLKPDIIMVTPSYMLALGEAFRRHGLDPTKTGIRIGIHGAEPWSNEMRREIETMFGIDAVDIYGLSEVIGPGVASECVESKDGPTIWEDHFYPEIVDPETGVPLPDGSFGELVFTSLTKEALPIIRYRTRDLTRLLPGSARAMRRMDRISGRTDDMMIIRGVNVFPTQIEELICQDRRLTPHYELHLTREGPLDELLVRVEGEAPEAGDDLSARIKDLIGVTARIELAPAGALARSEGKAKRIFDHRQ
jgi:phenylacetate-CoA ligase